MAAAAPLVAAFYSEPELVGITLVFALSFILIAIAQPFEMLLRKRLEFPWLALAEAAFGLSAVGNPKRVQSFFCTSMMVSAWVSLACNRSFFRRSRATSFAWGSPFLPRFLLPNSP